jgi:hypothetical protein
MTAREIAIPETPEQARRRFASWEAEPSAKICAVFGKGGIDVQAWRDYFVFIKHENNFESRLSL